MAERTADSIATVPTALATITTAATFATSLFLRRVRRGRRDRSGDASAVVVVHSEQARKHPFLSRERTGEDTDRARA